MSQIINPNNFLNSSVNNQKKLEKNSDNKNEDLDLQKNFLNLLIAQIKNQDPIDPIKNTELTSQLAQINTVGGIHQLNNTVEKFATHINKNQNLQVSSLIGHHVMVKYPHVKYISKKDVMFGMKLYENANVINIDIKDQKGNVVYHKILNDIPRGLYHITWNGQNFDETYVDEGIYDIFMTAQKNDVDVPIDVLSKAFVNSVVTSFSNDPFIDLGEKGTVTLSNIDEILP